jgi:RHS repeat-associated protein
MAKANPFRFSTKYQDDESDLLYYGYRYYKASTGTWVSRDPSEEEGSMNLYSAFENSPVNFIDPDGDSTLEIPVGPQDDGTDLTIEIVTDDKACGLAGINFLRKGGIDVYVWKISASGSVSYTSTCFISGNVPLNLTYVKNPPPNWAMRKLAKDKPIKESGSKDIPLCACCTLHISWNVSGTITVVPGTISDPTPPPAPPKK